MTKVELIAAVATEAGLSKKDAEKAVNTMLATITEELKKGEKVSLVGFGTFEVRERPERQGRNPQTKEPMTIAASKLPAFKAGKAPFGTRSTMAAVHSPTPYTARCRRASATSTNTLSSFVTTRL